MTSSVLRMRRRQVLALAGGMLSVPIAIGGPVVEALARPAVQLVRPESAVLMAAARAGNRWVAVGERGVVVFTDDDGGHWTQAESVPVSTTLTALRFVDALHGCAVGHGGVVLVTADAGRRWTRALDGRAAAQVVLAAARAAQGDSAAGRLADAERLAAAGPDKPFLDLHLRSEREAFVVGAYNLALHTRDGGRTWRSIGERIDNPKGLHLYAIAAAGETMYLAGEQGLLLRSDDAGQNFRRLPSPYVGSWFALAQPGPDTVIVGGLRGNAFVSRDRGEHWARIDGLPPVSIVTMTPDGSGLLLANQAGQLFLLDAGSQAARALSLPQLPPTNGMWAMGSGRLLALTAQGVRIVSARNSP